MTPRWRYNRLDLGLLGEVRVHEGIVNLTGQPRPGWWVWKWQHAGMNGYPNAEKAQRAAETFVRRAIKQAARRVE
jgi:hypothetical protein